MGKKRKEVEKERKEEVETDKAIDSDVKRHKREIIHALITVLLKGMMIIKCAKQKALLN